MKKAQPPSCRTCYDENMSHKKTKILFIIIVSLVVLATVSYATYTLFFTSKPVTEHLAKFTLDPAAISEWTSSGTNHSKNDIPATSETEADDIPDADSIIHLKDQQDPDGCFVIYSYWKKSANVEDLLKDSITRANEQSNPFYTPVTVTPIAMQSSSGPVSYEFHQYSIDGPNSETSMRGTAFGFAKVSSGYLDIRATCLTEDKLTRVLPVLSAVRFEE
jgi:hypothetical protein